MNDPKAVRLFCWLWRGAMQVRPLTQLLLCLIGSTAAVVIRVGAPLGVGAPPRVSAPRCAVRACTATGRFDDYVWEDGLTCVEYESGGELLLGVYVAYSVVNSAPHIRPLCTSSEEEGVRVMLHDE